MEVFEELKKLNLPPDEFMVLGSGILSALKIRDIADIDLLITEELFDHLRASGWKYEVVEIEGRQKEKLSFGPAEAFYDFWWEGEMGSKAKWGQTPFFNKNHGIILT